MAITYHAGRRIQATQADFDGTPAVSGGWKELGRTTWSSGNSFTVSSIPDKRYLMVLNYTDSASNYNNIMRFNSDTGLNYSWRRSLNGEIPDGTTKLNTNSIAMNGVVYDDFGFSVNYIANLSGKEKLVINHATDASAVGSTVAPDRQEVAGKWTGTDSIDEITVTTSSANYNLGETVVLGWDPADTHTSNFWEELASVETVSSGTLSSGTFTAKKYLWVQAYTPSSSNASPDGHVEFNGDSGTNYAHRRSHNGGADTTGTSDGTGIRIDGTGGQTAKFHNLFIINNASNEKLVIAHSITGNTAGAGNAPSRTESVGKWANTSNQITRVDIIDQYGSQNWGAGSFIKVWGSN
jgi:hypothetical protein